MAQVGLIVVGDEILSGKRQDKHMPKAIELLAERGMQLSWARYAGDDRAAVTQVLRKAFAWSQEGNVVLCTGGIGATPDDHTRQAAAAALDAPLALHPGAADLIRERMQDMARENKHPYEPDRPDNLHRLNMAVFPEGARLIPNPYNKIAGFSILSKGAVHFFPGFPVMAWPMMAWVLDHHHASLHGQNAMAERSVIVFGAMEATLTPLMEAIEAEFAGVAVFSLPSVDHPVHGRHIELGVKGRSGAADLAGAYNRLVEGLKRFDCKLGPEMVR